MFDPLSRAKSGLGLIAGPSLWALSTMLGSIWPRLECGAGQGPAAMSCFVFAAASLGASLVSWRSQAGARSAQETGVSHSAIFIASVASLVGVVFAYVLVLQGVTDLVLESCQR